MVFRITVVITTASAKEFMPSALFVCHCLCVQRYAKSYAWIYMKFLLLFFIIIINQALI